MPAVAPPVKKSVCAAPAALAISACACAMAAQGAYKSSVTGSSVVSKEQAGSSPKRVCPLWPGMWRLTRPETAESISCIGRKMAMFFTFQAIVLRMVQICKQSESSKKRIPPGMRSSLPAIFLMKAFCIHVPSGLQAALRGSTVPIYAAAGQKDVGSRPAIEAFSRRESRSDTPSHVVLLGIPFRKGYTFDPAFGFPPSTGFPVPV